MNNREKSREELLLEIESLRREVAGLRNQTSELKARFSSPPSVDSMLLTMLKNLPIDFWARDSEGRVLLQSDASINQWGDFREQQLGEHGLTDGIKNNWAENNDRALAGETITDENRITDKEGLIRHIYTCIAPIVNEGEVSGIMGLNVDLTKSKRLEKDRRLFEFIVENAGDAIFQTEESGKFAYANEAAHQTLGYSKEEMENLTVSDIDPTLPPVVWMNHWREIKDKKSITFETRLRTREGKVFPAEITSSYLKLDGREYVFSFVRNILSRKRVERALAQSEEKYRLLFTKALDGILLIDGEDWKIIEANDAFLRITGYSREELFKMPPENLSQYPEIAIENMKRIMVSGGETLVRANYLKKGGIPVPVEISGVGFVFNGKPALLGVFRDVSERVLADEALRHSEEKYRLLVENAQEGICVIQHETICFANPALLEYSGYRLDDIQKIKPFDLVYPDDREAVEYFFNMILEKMPGVPRSYVCRLNRPDGTFWWALASGILIQWEDRPAVMALISNITSMKRGEEQLKTALTEKDVLLREIHHRVKNNMQVVSSLLSLQARKINDKALKSAFDEIRGRVMAMALVHETLYQSSSLSAIDLKQYVAKLVQTLSAVHGAGRRGVRISVDVESMPIGIDHAVPCGLVINELTANALEHAFPDRDSGEVWIRAKRIDNDRVEMEIQDNGIGYPGDLNQNGNNSLGLTLVRGLVEQQLGGTLEIQTDPGTKYIIRIPRGDKYRRPIKASI